MLQLLYKFSVRFPWLVILAIVAVTILFGTQIPNLQWETDARVYLPKGHPAILYDERIDELFGVKDAVIIGIVNEEEGIFNPVTLRRIARLTEKVAALPGVIANRTIDVASLATATVFVGTETDLGAVRVMANMPETEDGIKQLKNTVDEHRDLLIGNVVSADGTAAMIRAKLKEGQDNRYMTYFQIKALIDAELGKQTGWPQGGGWDGGTGAGGDNQWWSDPANGQDGAGRAAGPQNADQLYIAGRPVIEVTAGLDAMDDIRIMVPLLVFVMALVLFVIFKTLRGVLLPLFVMAAGIVWTMGTMALFDVPLFTISTMLPVILVAVGIGDAVHFLSHYYDNVLQDPHRPGAEIVLEVTNRLGPPLLITSLTTAIGFLALLFAEMPPFKIFGLFTVVGILFCWFISAMFISAVLTVMKPKVGNYFAQRRAMRAHGEQGLVGRWLVSMTNILVTKRTGAAAGVCLLLVVALWGSLSLYVDSSWMSDFRQDSELALSNRMLNEKFDGTIFLSAVVEGRQAGALKNPEILKKIEAMQRHVETLPFVGNSLSIVDYLKSLNKNLHAGDPQYDVLPQTREQIGEYLFLLSLSGRPEQLDEVVDYDYRVTNVSFSIKTDHTRDLKTIIDGVEEFVSREFTGLDVDVNLAGSANNSFIWAGLLIQSQTAAIVLSKAGIFVLAALLFRSVVAGLYTIVPVSITTLLIAGVAGIMAVPLDVSTALAAGVAIGVGVDYAVHYIYRYRRERKIAADDREAITATTRSVGKTIFFNAVVVTLGFLVLLASQFPPHAKLGGFVAAYMVLSCVVALVVLPMLIAVFRPKAFSEPTISAQ